ncbi:TPM domain-containing protein [Arcticibacterium luteifluviistationis]|uniref:TPM domain-containing protein n=1 Tax=Arcticibacterium luteifluviistationis TaxID=1784714 RepID=A0A2Z4G6D0_9BACT|nr:TPM domain-containing protein [Arcticibacterium luteifluviistationis]AWV96695.1 hypothetical protein DJ013_00185 [Arcticibacterium luteifluviistationis]
MKVFSEAEKERITTAIHNAELKTSGEIKVHVENNCSLDSPVERAKEVFCLLSLDHTALRNGVLFYLSISDRQFAILGDQGIHEKVGSGFWEEEKKLMLEYFQSGNTVEGLSLAIEMAGEALQKYFPYQSDDVNEISNDISFGNIK